MISIESIKDELMKRGPVVYVVLSFLASDASRKVAFHEKLKEKVHPVLIVGWANTAIGGAWNIISTIAAKTTLIHQVAFG